MLEKSFDRIFSPNFMKKFTSYLKIQPFEVVHKSMGNELVVCAL